MPGGIVVEAARCQEYERDPQEQEDDHRDAGQLDRRDPHVEGEDPPAEQVPGHDVAGVLALEDDDEGGKADPESSVGAERDRPERVAGLEFPPTRDQLAQAPIGERQRAPGDQPGVDQRQDERRHGETREPEWRGIRLVGYRRCRSGRWGLSHARLLSSGRAARPPHDTDCRARRRSTIPYGRSQTS